MKKCNNIPATGRSIARFPSSIHGNDGAIEDDPAHRAVSDPPAGDDIDALGTIKSIGDEGIGTNLNRSKISFLPMSPTIEAGASTVPTKLTNNQDNDDEKSSLTNSELQTYYLTAQPTTVICPMQNHISSHIIRPILIYKNNVPALLSNR